MKKQILILLATITVFLLSSCSKSTPYHHPMHPNYNIIKPKVKFKVSKKNLASMVKKLQGSPYVWAEEGPNKFDCSGFTYYMYGSMGIQIPRVARHQAKSGIPVDTKYLKYGDLIFFATNSRKPRKITHVGMYLAKGWFTHASTTKHKVIYSNLYTSKYYRTHLRGSRRYLPQEHVSIAKAPRNHVETQASVWKPKRIPPAVVPPVVPQVMAPVFPSATSCATIRPPLKISTPIKARNSTTRGKETSAMQMIERHTVVKNPSFYVQVGSFIGSPKHTLLDKIKNRGFKYKKIRYLKDKQQASKVLIGPYATRSQSITALNTIRTHINPAAFITLRIE